MLRAISKKENVRRENRGIKPLEIILYNTFVEYQNFNDLKDKVIMQPGGKHWKFVENPPYPFYRNKSTNSEKKSKESIYVELYNNKVNNNNKV